MNYDFKGKHYIASFKNCRQNINISSEQLVNIRAALELANTTIISHVDHSFENGGYTCVFLLSESHCSIHTYPEHKNIFIDLFTCGDKCDVDIFHERMIEIFKPDEIDFKIINRD